jgi:small subunit ribosomal protein S16
VVKIRLKRLGTKKRPYYRVVVMDSRQARDSRTIDEVGIYHPLETEDKQFSVKEEAVKAWLGKGAQPSPTVKRLLNKKGITVK